MSADVFISLMSLSHMEVIFQALSVIGDPMVMIMSTFWTKIGPFLRKIGHLRS